MVILSFFSFHLLISFFWVKFYYFKFVFYDLSLVVVFDMRNHKLMFVQILFINFSTSKLLLSNHFHILKNLSPKRILLLLMSNINPNIELGLLWLLRLSMDFYTRLFFLKYLISCTFFPSCIIFLFIWISITICYCF